MTELILIGILIHLFCDWFLQNEWMAINKVNPKHVAGYLHAAIHTLGMMFIFPIWAAILIGALHWLIDLRFILAWWRKFYKQTADPNNPASLHVAFWQDQVAHIIVIALISEMIK